MAKHPHNVLAASRRALLLCVTGTALAAILGLFLGAQEAVAFESFSSFTFGSVPGGEPRFNFNGFNPGAAGGQQGRGAVDNEGYYKVGVKLPLVLISSISQGREWDSPTTLVHTADAAGSTARIAR